MILSGLVLPLEPARAAQDPVLLAAGDIASCNSVADGATAQLAEDLPGTVAMLGDARYQKSPKCYEDTWGPLRNRIRPTVGNHDIKQMSWYFQYFGSEAGPAKWGYYSYDLGAWHIVVLNSNCSKVGGCGANSAQARWLRQAVGASSARCTLAYWHHPRFSSDRNYGNDADTSAFWDALYKAGAEVVLNGHAHIYERFAPQSPKAKLDDQTGIRQFTVGTGGASHYPLGTAKPNSEVRENKTFAILRLTLHDAGYDWQFVPEAGSTFTDAGTTACH
jgi:hypothetical protein